MSLAPLKNSPAPLQQTAKDLDIRPVGGFCGPSHSWGPSSTLYSSSKALAVICLLVYSCLVCSLLASLLAPGGQSLGPLSPAVSCAWLNAKHFPGTQQVLLLLLLLLLLSLVSRVRLCVTP